MNNKCIYQDCYHCTHYKFNPNKDGNYIGKGHCLIYDKQSDPEDGDNCKHFYCTLIKDVCDRRKK